MKRLFCTVAVIGLMAGSAQAGSPVTINNPANTQTAVVDSAGLHMVCDSGCSGSSGTPSIVNLAPTTTATVGNGTFATAVATSGLVAKASPANNYGYTLTEGTTAAFFAFLNATTIPTASAAITPLECIPVAASTAYRVRQDIPDRYSVGLVVVNTSSCTVYTAVVPTLMTVWYQ